MMRKLFFAFVSVCFAGVALAQDRVVNVYNWSDYIDPKVLGDFTRETGIRVVYDTYDSNESLETKLLAGKTGYDVVVPSAPFLQRQQSVLASCQNHPRGAYMRAQFQLERDHCAEHSQSARVRGAIDH